jgi:hypothetical protein
MSETLFMSPDRLLKIDTLTFEAELSRHFGDDGVTVRFGGEIGAADVFAQIDRPNEETFQVLHSRRGTAVWTDGDEDQTVDIALWVLSLVPEDPGGRVWMTDEHFATHVELRSGMSKDDLVNCRWVDHREHPPDLSG